MSNVIISWLRYVSLNWESLFVGGITTVGIVIFLMGILKKFLINKIKNDMVRRVVLAWLSLIITLPITIFSLFIKEMGMDHFWSTYAVNCLSVVIIYWLYENTALRDSLALLGKKTLTKFFGSAKENIDSLCAVEKTPKEFEETKIYNDDYDV